MKYCSLGKSSIHWITLTTAAIVILLGLILVKTIITPDTPIKVIGSNATGYRISDVTVIEYDRNFEVYETFLGRVSRVVECEGIRTFDIPTITRPFTEGVYNTSRTFSVPFRYPNGSKCILRTLVEWKPTLSLKEHLFEIETVEFTIVAPPACECKKN